MKKIWEFIVHWYVPDFSFARKWGIIQGCFVLLGWYLYKSVLEAAIGRFGGSADLGYLISGILVFPILLKKYLYEKDIKLKQFFIANSQFSYKKRIYLDVIYICPMLFVLALLLHLSKQLLPIRNPIKFINIIFIAPFIEEILFRGIVLPPLVAMKGKMISLVAICLIFAGAHYQSHNVIIPLVIGFTATLAYIKHQDLLSCIIIHCFGNIAYAVYALMHAEKVLELLE